MIHFEELGLLDLLCVFFVVYDSFTMSSIFSIAMKTVLPLLHPQWYCPPERKRGFNYNFVFHKNNAESDHFKFMVKYLIWRALTTNYCILFGIFTNLNVLGDFIRVTCFPPKHQSMESIWLSFVFHSQCKLEDI